MVTPTNRRTVSQFGLGFQVLERLTCRKGTSLLSPAELRLKEDTAFPPETRRMWPGLNVRRSDQELGISPAGGGLLPEHSSFPCGPQFTRTRKLSPKGKKSRGTADRPRSLLTGSGGPGGGCHPGAPI